MVDILGGALGGVMGLFGYVFYIIWSMFPYVVMGLFVLIFVLLAIYFYFYMKHHYETIDIFTPRQATYVANVEASFLLKDKKMKDIWIAGDGKTPQIKLGNIVGFNIEPSKIKTISSDEAIKYGLDRIVTIIFRDTKSFWKKIWPTLVPIRFFIRELVDGNFIGTLMLNCSGLKKKGLYYYPTVYGNFDPLYIENLRYEVIEASFEKAQDKWGQFADLNTKQKEWHIMDVDKAKTTIDIQSGQKPKAG